MLIPLSTLVEKYNIKFTGILHVGAHECEELEEYEKYISRDKILWIEAMKDKVQLSRKKYPGVRIVEAIVSDDKSPVEFNVSNNGQSSSILKYGLHSQYYPGIVNVYSILKETQLLIDILNSHPNMPTLNFLNFDIQGAELKALRGMEAYLGRVDYIYCEVNSDYVYENCALVGEIDEYLAKFGLKRVETAWTDCKWGDAFYIRG